MDTQTSRRLKMLGMFLFLLGLLTSLVIMMLTNPRMGLSAHLSGVMNGTFLVVAGLIWNELKISGALKKVLFWVLLYDTYMLWFFTLLSAIFGTSQTTPIAGAGHSGTAFQENLIRIGFTSVALTMVVAIAILVYGLRGKLSIEKND